MLPLDAEAPGSTPPPQMIELAKPRALTPGEREILEFLTASPLSCDPLREQLSSASVITQCDCGCPSVGLTTDGPIVPDALVVEREPVGRDDYFAIKAVGRNREWRMVDVILHVGSGEVSELEIWAAVYGGSPETDLPPVATLRYDDS